MCFWNLKRTIEGKDSTLMNIDCSLTKGKKYIMGHFVLASFFLLNIIFLFNWWTNLIICISACILHDTAVCLKSYATIINCEVDCFSFPF